MSQTDQSQSARKPGALSRLGLKHRIATSALAGPFGHLRGKWRWLRAMRYPELGLLHCEDDCIEAVMARRIKPDWNCLDVGAHLGSVFYRMTQLAPNGQHAMIEASPGKAQLLKARFGADIVHEVAASDRDGEVTFYENLDQPGFSSLGRRTSRGRVVERRVAARRIDDVLGPDAQIDFIKIDVEGFEYPALKGAETLLRRCLPTIQFEAGAVQDSDLNDENETALFDWLTRDLGYEIFAAFDLHFDRPAISSSQFSSYRSYPFLAFNYFAIHPMQGQKPVQNDTTS